MLIVLVILVVLVLGFLLILADKAFKSKTTHCNFKITVSLRKGFSLELNTTDKKDAPTDK